MNHASQSVNPRKRRLPTALNVILFLIGMSWLVLTLINARINPSGVKAVDAMSLAANASGALLLLLTAFFGTLRRPAKPVPGYGLALIIAVSAIPVIEAVFSAKLAQQHGITGSASSDIFVITVAAMAAVMVYRSRPAQQRVTDA